MPFIRQIVQQTRIQAEAPTEDLGAYASAGKSDWVIGEILHLAGLPQGHNVSQLFLFFIVTTRVARRNFQGMVRDCEAIDGWTALTRG